MFKKKNIVITGALGQDGIILSKILLKKNFNVLGLVKKINTKKLKKVSYHKINLSDYNKICNFLDKIDPFSLIHFGSDNPDYKELKKKDFYKNNLKSTKNLIKYFSLQKPNRKLILIGSSQMYKKSKKIVNLKSNFDPSDSYTKFRVESYKDMLNKKKIYKSNIITAILFNHDSIQRNKKFLIPRLIRLVKAKKYMKLNEIYKENISGDFSHAEDICNGLYKLIISKNNYDKLIFSSNIKTSINEIIEFLLKKNKIKNTFINPNLKNNSNPVGDNSFTKNKLNWKIKKNIFIAVDELNKL